MKNVTKRLRLTQNEWEHIQKRMQDTQESFSSYALSCMLNTKRKKIESAINRDLVIELARWGNNLNQVSKHLNTKKGGLDRVGLEMLRRIEEHLHALRVANGC